MSKIKILPEILSNKIAAGEVVERPASVVKELVENALDAKSTRITVEIEAGGRSMVRVSDNGCGMNRDDALLALERYATSKIYTDDDLFSIQTLGFRGEALPSIASVSKLSLVSREAGVDAGTEVTVDGGRIRNVVAAGAPPGTMITVRRIFFNTPARRKFLKTVNTEMGHITDTVAAIAMGHASVRFRLVHNGRTIRDWPATEDGRQRAGDILGSGLDRSLLAVDLAETGARVSGWVAPARVTRPTSRGLYLYVNGRFIRDRGVQRALFDAYSGRIMRGQFPVAVLFLSVPADRVDVNVHPTKHEVRFADQRAVFETVRRAAAAALKDADPDLWAAPADPVSRPAAPEYRISEPRRLFSSKSGPAPFAQAMDAALGRAQRTEDWTYRPAEKPAAADPAGMNRTGEEKRIVPQGAPAHRPCFADLRVVGQLGRLYLVCEADDGMILIDQHAAHERVVFEALKHRSGKSGPASQRLLVPETVDLDAREAAVMETLVPDLKEIGLELEPFGGSTFVVKAVPALLDGREAAPLVREIAGKMAETGYAPEVAGALDPVLTLMACHTAIRAGQDLGEKEMRALLHQLDGCENPSHCPHGRPTWIQWRFKDLEKCFRR